MVVWMDERRADKAWDIYARRSADGGGTWEPEQLLSRFPQQSMADLAARPEMISDGQDRFWVVWLGLRNGRSRFYLSRSVDGGRTWADPVELSGQSERVFNEALESYHSFYQDGYKSWQNYVKGVNEIGSRAL